MARPPGDSNQRPTQSTPPTSTAPIVPTRASPERRGRRAVRQPGPPRERRRFADRDGEGGGAGAGEWAGPDLISILRPMNLWGGAADLGVPRPEYLSAIRRMLSARVAVAVKGVRRAGKTTIVRQFLADAVSQATVPAGRTLYVNLDDPALPTDRGPRLLDEIITAHRAEVDRAGPALLVLDEVPRVAGWERWVRSSLDRSPERRIILTGSSSELLSPELGSSLTGRHLDVVVWPLSFREYLRFHQLDPLARPPDDEAAKALAQAYLMDSGFPEVVRNPDPLVQRALLQQVFRDILARDVVERWDVKGIHRIESVARLLLHAVPGPVTVQSLARSLDGVVSFATVLRFSRYLEEPYLLSFVRAHSFKSRVREKMPRKVYAVDNGLLRMVVHRFSRDTGRLLEQAVFQELRRRHEEIYYVPDPREVDFLVWEGERPLMLLSACADLSAASTRSRELTALDLAMAQYRLRDSTIVTLGPAEEATVSSGRIRIIPFHRWAIGDRTEATGPTSVSPSRSGSPSQ